MQERGVEGRKEEWKVGKRSGRWENGVEGRKTEWKVGKRSGRQKSEEEGRIEEWNAGKRCGRCREGVRSERVESRGKKIASKWNKIFLNFYFLFSHKHKNYVYLFRIRGYDEEERKEVENKRVPCDTRARQIFIKF